MQEIDRNSPVPIYFQLKNIIRDQIERGLLVPGDQLPTEQELCQMYGISRSPVRQALSELAYEGVIVRRPALGTFIAERKQAEESTTTPLHIIGTDMRWITLLRRAALVWNEEHPAQPVTLNTKLVSHDTLHHQLSTAVGGGTAPDIGMLDCVWVSEFAKAGYLFPLKTLDSAWVDQEYTTDLYPASMAANAFQGDLFGIQFEADISLLWYRKDWFDQEGLHPPNNWDELQEIAFHFMQPEVIARYATSPHALAFPGGTAGGEATVYNLTPFIWSAGGEIFENGYVTLNSSATLEALAFLRSLVRNNISPVDVVRYTWDQVPRQFASGQFAMSVGGSYEASVISETAGWSRREFAQRIGLVPIPAAPEREPAATLGGMSCAVFRQSRHPELAIGILQTAMQTDLLLEFCRLTMQHTPRPSLTKHFVSTSEPFLAETGKMLTAARARPTIPEYAIVSRQLQEMFQAILTTTTPIPEIVTRTCEFINVVTNTLCLDHP